MVVGGGLGGLMNFGVGSNSGGVSFAYMAGPGNNQPKEQEVDVPKCFDYFSELYNSKRFFLKEGVNYEKGMMRRVKKRDILEEEEWRKENIRSIKIWSGGEMYV